MNFTFYQLLTRLGGPLIDLYLAKRKMLGKEDKERFAERLGHASMPRPSGTLCWVHAASVGEAISVLPLIKKIAEDDPNISILLTTGTVTSARLLEKRLPRQAFHQYVPVDKFITVRRFLHHWKPDVALFVESEFWPNLIIETYKTGCVMAQVNAAISQDSFEKWKRASKLARKILSCFSLTLPQTPEDGKRLEGLGAKNVKYIGNLKFDAPALPADPKETGRLVNTIGERQIWLAASTHANEEETIGSVHKKLKENHPNLLTIIAPRHPERADDIREKLTNDFKLKAALRSTEEEIEEDTDIYIADTLGELGLFYRLTGICFIGGSLVPTGGHNPLEAARLECAILSGPYVENFTRIYNELQTNKAYVRVADAVQLASEVDKMLNDHDAQEALATAALELVESKAGVMEGYAQALRPYLQKFITPAESTSGTKDAQSS